VADMRLVVFDAEGGIYETTSQVTVGRRKLLLAVTEILSW